MSATLTTPTLPLLRPQGHDRPRPRGLTLEQRLEGAWEGLRSGGAAECPLCRAPMRRHGNHALCSGCGSRLS